MIEAITLASRDFAADPARWVAAMRKARPDVPEADLKLLAEAFAGSWSTDGGITRPSSRRRRPGCTRARTSPASTPAPLDAWADFAPLDRVLARIGPAEAPDALTR